MSIRQIGSDRPPDAAAPLFALPRSAITVGGEVDVGGPAVVLVVRADCPTCQLVLPLASRLDRALGGDPSVVVVSQSPVDEVRRVLSVGESLLVVVDEDLVASTELAVEAVPAWYRVEADGRVTRLFYGWNRTLFEDLVSAACAGRPLPALELHRLPPHQPGCGSRTLEPRPDGDVGRLRSRLIELDPHSDPTEFFFDAGLTDGLPVVPPTPERVLEMLAGTPLEPAAVVGKVPPSYADATVEKIAVAAVMAGCRPAFLPVVIASVAAVCDDAFDLHGVLATTYNAAPLLLVNGDVRGRIGMNSSYNVLGQGNRPNATIGRAVQLLIRNVGGGRPGEVDMAVHGQPGKFTYCLAEAEEVSPWEPLSKERGYRLGVSVVTAAAVEGPRLVADEQARTPEQLTATFAACLATVTHPKIAGLDAVILLAPQHARIFARAEWSKQRVKETIWEQTKRPLESYLGHEAGAEGTAPELLEQWRDEEGLVPKVPTPDDLIVVVAGAPAGAMSSIMGGWWPGPKGSTPVTKPIVTRAEEAETK